MRLGIDLDGVVCDFNAGWMRLHMAEFGSKLKPEMVVSWNNLHELGGFADMPAFWNASIFCSSVMRSGGALSGRSTLGGCGSKIIATAVPFLDSACRRTSSKSLRWPRWTPSKLPSPTTGAFHRGRGVSGKYAICITG